MYENIVVWFYKQNLTNIEIIFGRKCNKFGPKNEFSFRSGFLTLIFFFGTYSCGRGSNRLTPVNKICTAGSGRSEVVLSAYWSITEWILYPNNCRYAHLTFWSRRWDQTGQILNTHGYCWRAYKILWGSQSTCKLQIFGVQKPISEVKTPKTSTSASTVAAVNQICVFHEAIKGCKILKIH